MLYEHLFCCAYTDLSTPTSIPSSTVVTPNDSTTTIIIVVLIISLLSAGGACVAIAACIRYRVRKSREQKTERYSACTLGICVDGQSVKKIAIYLYNR